MSCVAAGHGMGDCLRYLVNKVKPDDLVLRLFKNDVCPAEAMDASAYEEAGFPGYYAVPLDGRQWAVSDGPEAVAEYAQQAFTRARARAGEVEKVYGYYLTRASTGRVAWAERFEAPAEMAHADDRILVTPRIALG